MTQAAAPKIQTGKWRYDRDLECMVEVRADRNYFSISEKRSDLPCPAMHAGGMPTIKSMCDGKFYETKRNYYKSVSRAGCEIVGMDKRWEEQVKAPNRDKADLHDVAASVQRAVAEERNKLPPAGGIEDRRLMRKQRRKARGIA